VQFILKCLAPVAYTTSTIGILAFFLSTADHLLTTYAKIIVNKTDKNIGSYKINYNFVISVRLICNNKHILTITLQFLRANLVLASRINVPGSPNFGSTWIRFPSTKIIISATSWNSNDDRGTDLIMTPISSQRDKVQLRKKVPFNIWVWMNMDIWKDIKLSEMNHLLQHTKFLFPIKLHSITKS